MKRKAFTLPDAAILVALLAGNWLLTGVRGKSAVAVAVEVVSASGAQTVKLGPDRDLPVEGPLGTTVIRVQRDGARVKSSPCPFQLCVRSGKATRPGQVVACLPNRVALRILGSGARAAEGVDAVGR